MKMTKLTIAGFTTLTAMSGCASIDNATAYKTGTEVTPEIQQQLITGKTTRDDAARLLGPPQSIETVGQDLHYVYNYSEISHFSGKKSELARIVFDSEGPLKEIQKSAGTTANPLTGGR